MEDSLLFLTLLNKVEESKEKNMTVATMIARVVRNSPHNSVFKEDILPEVTAMCRGLSGEPNLSLSPPPIQHDNINNINNKLTPSTTATKTQSKTATTCSNIIMTTKS